MKKLLITVSFIFYCSHIYGQEKLAAFFEKKIDTLYSDSKKEISHKLKITIANPEKFGGAKIELIEVKNDLSPSGVFFPSERIVNIENSKESFQKEMKVKFERNIKHDRLLILKLKAENKNGDVIQLVDSIATYKIYIKPLDSLDDAKRNGYEFWLFTGTNIDLLDGAKARELYFKGSYLVNFTRNDTTTRSWMYFTFGKNRFFSTKDSLSRIEFFDIPPDPSSGDSINIVNGYYSSLRETVTENVFLSIDFLYNLREISSKRSKVFVNGGFYFGLQDIKTNYTNHRVISDTSTYFRIADSSYSFRPMLRETKVKQANYNISLGLTHMLSTDKINVKTHLTTGINVLTFPFHIVRTNVNELVNYSTTRKLFTQLRIDATVLNPGISIGFETFLRYGEIPLFNVSFTKVLDIKQISTLFGKLPTAIEGGF